MQASEPLSRRDEAALYVATAIAAAAALLGAGGGAGSTRVGLVAAALGCAGVFLSWHTRQWGWVRRLALGLAGGAAAAAALQGLIGWEIAVEASDIYRAPGDVGLTMGLGMTVLLVAFTYVLVVQDMLPFSLVPALAMFGLIGSRGSVAFTVPCFVVFVPAALATVGQAMLLSGAPRTGRSAHRQWHFPRWRRWHWMTLGVLTAAIMLLGYLLFIPVAAYATQYQWPLQLMLASDGFSGFRAFARSADPVQTYSIGRGPVMLRDIPVLSVQGPPAEYWRGEVFDVYTGRGWMKDESASSAAWTDGDVVDLGGLVRFDPDARIVTHTIRAEQDLPFVFYSAGQIRRVTLGGGAPGGSTGRFMVDKYGCLASPGGVFQRGDSYQVVSELMGMGSSTRPGARGTSRVLQGEPEQSYLRVPLSARRVADLARRVAGGADSSIGKLRAIITYLQQNCIYTLDAPPVPQGEDAADHFLLRQKRGYCDMFATSLALMARAVGVPTRFALGYAGGTYDPERDQYVILESDAHAWVEAYVSPWGWVGIDATPAGEAPPIPPLRRTWLRLRFFLQDHPVAGMTFAVVLFSGLLLSIILSRRAAGSSLRARAKRDSRAAVIWAYDQLCRLLRRVGRRRRPSQTPLEFLASLESAPAPPSRARARALPPASLVPVRGLTEIFIRARYGPGPVTEQTAHLALERLTEAREAVGRRAPRPPD